MYGPISQILQIISVVIFAGDCFAFLPRFVGRHAFK